MPTDIKNTGYQSYRDLQKQNAEAFTQQNPEVSDWYRQFKQRGIESYGNEPTEYVGRQAAGAGYGTSKYDRGLVSANQLGDLQDVRYENQPWYDTLANGVGKMLGTAGTTFLSSLVGLPVGAATAAVEGRWSGLWDNAVTNALGDVDEWMENNLTNYKSTEQQNNKWWQNMDTMNFWADNVIKNVGFTLGAAASMATGAGALGLMGKSLGIVNNVSKAGKITNNIVSALFSATGEGMIEARNGVEERNKLELQKLEDALAPEREALEMEKEQIDNDYALTGNYDDYQRKMSNLLGRQQDLDNRLNVGRQQIEESGREMGNKILLGNQILLTAGNLIQFGKMMSKSFDSARHAAEVTSKAAKPFGVTARMAGNTLKEGYKVTGKVPGRIFAATKGILTEGSEEMNQQWIQSSAGAAYNEKDVNDYWRAKLDPEAYRETTKGLYTLGNAISQGFSESWGDSDQWEQFVIGGLTGMAGSYAPTKLFNQDTTKSKWNPQRYGEWAGGAYNEVKDFNQQYNQYAENVDDLNKVLASEDFGERTRNLIAHTYFESSKDEALQENDKKTWKDEDDKQAIHDIQAFLRAGKLDDLKTIYDEMGKDLSDEDIDDIVKRNTKKEVVDGKTVLTGPYFDDKGNQIKTRDEIREEVKHNADELNRKLDSYLDSIDVVNRMSGGNLTKDQEDNLAYLHNMGKESLNRADKIMTDRRKDLPQKFLFKTSKSPEELSKDYASSDLAFTKNDDTPEGYVEVDTSLMNGSNFTNFFVRDIIMGGNLMPEFGETADERAVREEGEKNLTGEQKKARRIEKAKEKLQEANEQRNKNLELIEKTFKENFKGTQAEQDMAAENLVQDLLDAYSLVNQAGEFRRTFDEYMANPGKVDEAKEKITKEAEKKNTEERAKSQFGGKTSKDIKNDLNEGNTSFEDLDSFIKGAEKGEIKADPETVESAKGAMEMENKQRSLEGALNNIENPTVAADAKQLLQWMANSAEGAEEISVDALANFDAGALISDEEAEYMYRRGMSDEEILENAEIRKQAAIDATIEAFNALEEDQDKKSKIPTEVQSGEESGTMSFGDTGHDATTQSPSNQGKDDVIPASPEAEKSEEPASATPGEAEAAIKEAMQAQQVPQTDNGGTWRNNTRRYGYHSTTTPYHEIVADKNSLLYKRSKAIYDFLNAPDATGLSSFDHVENASEDRVRRNDTIRFRAKSLAQEIFGKPFSELTEQEKKDSIVIFMVDEKGNVLGDLPYPAFEPSMRNGNPTKDVILLQGLYTRVTDEFIKKNEKDGTADTMVDGSNGLNMKFKNGKTLVGQVFEVKTGNVPYSNERKTLNIINTDSQTGAIRPFTLAIKVIDEQINTGHKQKADAYGPGKVGQCYILIPDASGKSIAVPFATPAFNASEMRDTELYKFLAEALTELEKYSDVEAAKAGKNKEERNKAIDTLCAILQIESPFLDIQKDRVVFRYNRIGEENKQKIELSKSDDWKDRLLDVLSGTPIQVSLRYINKNIGVGRKTRNYNEVIGEIAHTNLPENTTHTVGSWFTLRNLSEEGPQQTKQVKYPEGVTRPYAISDGRTVVVTSGNVWSAADPNTGAVIEGDAVVDLALAQMQAINKDAKDGFIQVDINGTTRKYDVKNNKFVENKKSALQPLHKDGDVTSEVSTKNGIKITKYTQYRTTKSGEVKPITGKGGLQIDSSAISEDSLEDAGRFKEIRLSELREGEGKIEGTIWAKDADGWIQFDVSFTKDPRTFVTSQKSVQTDDFFGAFSNWNPGTEEEASSPINNKPKNEQKNDIRTLINDNIKSLNIAGGNAIIDEILAINPDLETSQIDGLIEKAFNRSPEAAKWLINNKGFRNKLIAAIKKEGNTEQQQNLQPEEVEKRAKALGISSSKTQYAWNAIPEESRRAIMEGKKVAVTFNGTTKEISVNSVQEAIKVLQEWNVAMKRNPNGMTTEVLNRRVDDAERRKADIQKERRWLQKNLPMFNTEERLHLIQGLLEIPGEESWAWGRFEKGVITLSDRAAGGTLYHEAFHAVTQTLLSDDELDNLYEAAVKHYNEKNVALVEELLAEDFRKYVQREETPIIGPVLKFFRKILNAIRNISGYRAPIHQLFYRINNGEFSDSIPKEARVGNAFYSRYINRVSPRIAYSQHPLVKDVVKDFSTRNIINDDPAKVGNNWSKFKEYWKKKDIIVEGHYCKNYIDRRGWVIDDIRIDLNGAELTIGEFQRLEERQKRQAEEYAAKQAMKGRMSVQQWDRLTRAEKMSLEEYQMSREIWDNMTVGEQEQWLNCHV